MHLNFFSSQIDKWLHYVVVFFVSISSPPSDYIIKEKTAVLQKKDNEGFGFVLRGAKGECRMDR